MESLAAPHLNLYIFSGFRQDSEDRRVLREREDSEDVGQGTALPHQAQELHIGGEQIFVRAYFLLRDELKN